MWQTRSTARVAMAGGSAYPEHGRKLAHTYRDERRASVQRAPVGPRSQEVRIAMAGILVERQSIATMVPHLDASG